MRRRRSTRSVIKLLAAAAVATVSIVSLGRLSTPPARGELPLCEDIEEIDTNVLIKPPKQGNAPEQLMDFLRTYKNEHRPGDEDDDDDEKEPQRSRVEIDVSGYTFEDMAAMANALDDEAHGKVCLWGRPRDGSIRLPTLADRLKERFARPLWPKSLRIPRPYRRNLVIHALAFALAVLAMARAAMAVRRWRRANAEVRWRRARDHTS